MTATSEHLAAAAEQLDALLRAGQRELAQAPDDARIAGHARDHVAAGLASTLTAVLPHLTGRTDREVLSVVVPLIGGLHRRSTRLDAPPVLHLLHDPPPTVTARRWIRAAVEIEPVAVQIARTGPVPPAQVRALVTDLAALSSALVFTDEDLGRALLWTDDPTLEDAARALLDPDAVWLRRAALTALTALGQGPHDQIPRYYDLTAPTPPVTVARQAADIPAALRHIQDLIRDQPLTHAQHAVVAHALTAIAHRLRRDVLRESPTVTDAAVTTATTVDQFVRAHLAVATAWSTTSYLRYGDPERLGAWQAALQLRGIAELLAPQHHTGHLDAEQLRQTLSLLAGLARAVNENFADSLARAQWHVADLAPDNTLTWNTVVPANPDDLSTLRAAQFDVGDGQVAYLAGRAALTRILTVQDAATDSAQRLHTIAGPAERPPDPRPATGPTARDILHASPAPVMPPTPATDGATPQQLAALTDLIRTTLPPRIAAAVLADPHWPDAAVQLHRADQRLAPGALADALRNVGDHLDPTAKDPARSVLNLLHASSATSLGTRLASQTHTADPRQQGRARTRSGETKQPPARAADLGRG